MGSDISRAKFDFQGAGYDPKAMRKQSDANPDRKVIQKVEEDMEVFMTDTREDPNAVDLDLKNEESSMAQKQKVEREIFSYAAFPEDSMADKHSNMERLLDIEGFQKNIVSDEINAQDAYQFFKS